MSSQHEPFRKATFATLRALSGAQEGGEKPDFSALNNDELSPQAQTIIRSDVDAKALYQRYHNPELAPAIADREAQRVFDAVEHARCEVYGARHMAGVRANLLDRLTRHCTALRVDDMTKREDMPAPLALELLTRQTLDPTTYASLDHNAALQQWRQSLSPQAQQALKDMAHQQGDQKEFSQASQHFIEACGLHHTTAEQQENVQPPTGDNANPDPQKEESPSPEGDEEGEEGATDEESGELSQEGSQGGMSENPDSDEMEALPTSDDQGEEEAAGPSSSPTSSEGSEHEEPYHVFTQEFDEEIYASDLCDPEELEVLRDTLDEQLEQTQEFVSRLAHRLQRRLMAQQQRHWFFDQEEGILDSARLPRIISNPALPLSYKREGDTEFRDTVVTLLVDNSGSMRGRPIATAAICGDILARTLERCGVKVEVLGFTTRTWKGGQSRVKWLQEDRPPQPGRLNDLRHIIYKSADMPWRRARRNIGLMLREGLLKENIDGEALLWAWKRLKHRPEHRRILMVISDGAPVDDSTSTANSPDYLDQHLHRVIAQLESDKSAELLAIGIGHDVTRYYQDSVTIGSAEDLGDTMVSQLTTLLSSYAHARRR
ncbi:cobaltochelatase CobT-related protein [Saccharibacter floricola]|uniref:Cobalamin biosynthesis protein CobT n=1 Tax=Saccharibacter floricola DSM 15669 TaxID=1123227 RepID=A0ABQ0NWD1_9PROT|nr:hypothetical protein [Saccharibacter floricola]GBQ04679.1 cobalamin biosynthesis protein CobT [Saccharibacter floricola DSM 15669]